MKKYMPVYADSLEELVAKINILAEEHNRKCIGWQTVKVPFTESVEYNAIMEWEIPAPPAGSQEVDEQTHAHPFYDG